MLVTSKGQMLEDGWSAFRQFDILAPTDNYGLLGFHGCGDGAIINSLGGVFYARSRDYESPYLTSYFTGAWYDGSYSEFTGGPIETLYCEQDYRRQLTTIMAVNCDRIAFEGKSLPANTFDYSKASWTENFTQGEEQCCPPDQLVVRAKCFGYNDCTSLDLYCAPFSDDSEYDVVPGEVDYSSGSWSGSVSCADGYAVGCVSCVGDGGGLRDCDALKLGCYKYGRNV